MRVIDSHLELKEREFSPPKVVRVCNKCGQEICEKSWGRTPEEKIGMKVCSECGVGV